MNFGFTDEQELLRSEVRKFLDERCPLEEVRRITEAKGPGYSPELWKEIAELGWTGLVIPEEHGGAGLGWVDWVVLLEETGRSLFPSPLLSNTLAAAAIRAGGNPAQQARWLPGLARGTEIGSLVLREAADASAAPVPGIEGRRQQQGWRLSGEQHGVPDLAAATLLVVPFRSGPAPEDLRLAVLDAQARGLRTRESPGMDLTKRMGSLQLDDVPLAEEEVLGALPSPPAALARLLDLAAAAVTAEMVGAAEAALACTVRYARERVQFGSPIGRYQGVKHPLAEMYVDLESFKSLLYYAAWCLDESPEEAPRFVSMAKAYASDAFARIGIDAVQLHGAVGYTWEYDPHLYLKRSKWARAMYGDAHHHYARVAALGGL